MFAKSQDFDFLEWTHLLLINLFCVSCNQEQKETEVINETKVVDKETAIEEPEKKEVILTVEQTEVYEHANKFIKWYIENRNSLFAKRVRIVESDDENVASINLELLSDYLLFLKEKGSCCISTKFIESENKFWKDAYEKTRAKQIIWEDGPDPWCFEADPIFYGHDWPSTYKEWEDGWNSQLDKESIIVKGDTATFYLSLKREMIKEDGKWKLNSWFFE